MGSMIHEFTIRYRNLSEMESICFQAAELARSGQASRAAETLSSYRPQTAVSRVLKELGESIGLGPSR
jgi:hypothetical protein